MRSFFIIIQFFLLFMLGANLQAKVIVANQVIEGDFHDTITGPGILGLVFYDSDSKTLTLNNVSISGPEQTDTSDYYYFRAIYVENSDITIRLIGENTISSFSGIYLRNSKCSFVGNGTLTINVPHLYGIMLSHCDTLSFKGCSVVINSGDEGNLQWPGLYVYVSTATQPHPDDPDNNCQVFIDSAALTIHSPVCMRNVVGMHLRGSRIVTPEGAYFDSDRMTVVDPDGNVCSDLTILPSTLGVSDNSQKKWTAWGSPSGIQIENVEVGDHICIYTTAGQIIHAKRTDQSSLCLPVRCGVYIVNVGKHSVKVIVP